MPALAPLITHPGRAAVLTGPAARAGAWVGLHAAADAIFDQRLDRRSSAPLAVAFSGGGDSLALLLAARTWADRAGRRVHAFTVDHQLQPAGASWALWCAARCRALGVAHATLVWRGDKPSTGVAAAARAARHRLIAEAAREAGAAVILMGHTADDRLEAEWMRREGASTPDPRVWSPSPVWPEGRGLFILRPWIDMRRADLRAGLEQRGETWIEDPANADPAQTRARARLSLNAPTLAPPAAETPASDLFDRIAEGAAGDLSVAIDDLLAAPALEARRALGAMLLCAAGTSRPPRGPRLDRLTGLIAARAPFTATLAGARVCCDGAMLRVARDAGELSRRARGDADLSKDLAVVFDGRFDVTARLDGLRIGALRGRAAGLPKADRAALKATSADARGACPVIIGADGDLRGLATAPGAQAVVKSLVFPRLAGALGVINCESRISRVAKTVGTS